MYSDEETQVHTTLLEYGRCVCVCVCVCVRVCVCVGEGRKGCVLHVLSFPVRRYGLSRALKSEKVSVMWVWSV